jgi:hypothetical protein
MAASDRMPNEVWSDESRAAEDEQVERRAAGLFQEGASSGEQWCNAGE